MCRLAWFLLTGLWCFTLAAQPQPLYDGDPGISDVHLSADGKFVAFCQNRPDQLGGDVAIRDLTTGKTTVLTKDSKEAIFSDHGVSPQVLPDNSGVVYEQGKDLWVATLDGKRKKLETGGEVSGHLVVPEKDLVVFKSQRVYAPGSLTGKWPEGVAASFITKLFVYTFKDGKVSPLTKDFVSDSGDLALMPDGRLVHICELPDKEGNFGVRGVCLVDWRGARERLCDAVFGFPPAYLKGGRMALVVDQVFDEKSEAFTYPILAFDPMRVRKVPSPDFKLPQGTQPGSMWTVPGARQLVIAAGDYDKGYHLYRFDSASGTLTQLTREVIGTADGGGITPDGKTLYFMGGKPGVSRGNLYKFPL